jgi:hypothetical protein
MMTWIERHAVGGMFALRTIAQQDYNKMVKQQQLFTSRAFCSDEVQSSSSKTAAGTTSDEAAADSPGEDLGAAAAEAAGAAEATGAAAGAEGAAFADISVLHVDIRPLAS